MAAHLSPTLASESFDHYYFPANIEALHFSGCSPYALLLLTLIFDDSGLIRVCLEYALEYVPPLYYPKMNR